MTDKLRSYKAAIKVIGNEARQETGRWLNNRAENSHQPFRRRERSMATFRSVKSLLKFVSAYASIDNHFLCTKLSMIGWLGLVLAPCWSFTRDWFAPVIAPLMIGCLYIGLIASNFLLAPDCAEFSSLAGVITLFSVPELVLAGWIHYLAFDLFFGAWEVKDAQKEGIHHWVLIPCLLATLMAGPVGLVLFRIVKLSYRAACSPAAGEV